MWDNDVAPGLSAIFGSKSGCLTAELTRSFRLIQNIRGVYIFLRFGFTHIDGIACFHYKIRLIFFRPVRPVNTELIRYRTNPFQNLIVCFEYESKVKLGGAIKPISCIIRFPKAHIHEFDNSRFLSRHWLMKIKHPPVVYNDGLVQNL